MNVEMEVEGLEDFRAALQQAKADVRVRAERAVRRSVFRVQTAARHRINRGPASGIVYEKYVPRRTHQASAPGQPPMSDEGRLAASIESDVSGLAGWVFTRLKYGLYQEVGTKRMAARPWLLPSIEEDAPKFREELMEILR